MSRIKKFLATAGFVGAAVGTAALPSAAAPPTWTSAGNMAIGRIGNLATPLADGRVLVTGGQSPASGNGGYDTKLAEIYNPSTNTWSTTGSTTNGRVENVASRLADGRVLLTGGENANICTSDLTTEIYDPSTGTWSFTGNLFLARAGATATLLTNGKVLVAGGGNRCGSVFSEAELYDPGTGTWSVTGSMTTGREWQSAVRLSDGRVLVAGGEEPFPFPSVSSAEIYDPATGTWSATGSMAVTRCCNHSSFLTLLADGRVLAAGGSSGFANFATPTSPSVEVYDPATGVWTPTGSMSAPRGGGTFSLLTGGKVLAAGGHDGTAYLSSAELWDPASGTWSSTASLATARGSHTATVLGNGKVLAVGGAGTGVDPYLSSAELYNTNVFDFAGFFSPVDNPPILNAVKAGTAIPVKFSLGGDQGLNVFAAGYPKSERVTCDASASLDDIEQTVTAGGSSLSYDATADRYTYVWKTDRGWANTCRKLLVQLTDGSNHTAYFKFK
jgi:N-acetylneuraminic acid mutarotase